MYMRSATEQLTSRHQNYFVIIHHPRITVRIQDEVLVLRTYCNSYLGTDKACSASGRPTTTDARHPESGVLNRLVILLP